MHSHDHDNVSGGDHVLADARRQNEKRLWWTLILVSVFMVVEVVGGYMANSLALLADAGHMLSDAASLGLALFAFWIARRPPNSEQTFGYYRAEILAALVNGASLLAISVYIFVEAYGRFMDPPEIRGPLMMAVATGGLVINLASLNILHGGKEGNLNIQGAWLHVLGDTLGSVGAILAGVGIWGLGWHWVDPAASVLIGALILFSSWQLLKQTISVLMESAPGHIDVDEVRRAIHRVDRVKAVHDLHIWTITSGLISLSAHVEVDDLEYYDHTLARIRTILDDEFGIGHMTIQIEPEQFEETEHDRMPV